MLRLHKFVQGDGYGGRNRNKSEYELPESQQYVSPTDTILTQGKSYYISSAEKIYDVITLYQDFAPLMPIFERYIAEVKEKYKGNENESRRADLVNAFIKRFHFDSFRINTCEILGVDGTNMTSESEPYWNAVDAKYRRRFYDLKEELITNADGSSEKRYVNSQTGFCTFAFFSVDENRLTGGVSFSNMWNEFQIYKDATITALSLINLLTPLESAYTTYEVLFGEMLSSAIPISYSGLYSERDLATSHILTVSNRLDPNFSAQINSVFHIVGTADDWDALNATLTKLKIYCADDQKLVVESDEIMNQQTRVMMNNLTASADGISSASDYGCLMYLAWLAFSDFFLDSWRKFSGMRDWLRLVGSDNVLDSLGKLDTYAVVNTGLDTILVTSGGFLRLTDGTVEKPEGVEWMSLETAEMNCGVSEELFSEMAYKQAKDRYIMLEPVNEETNNYGRVTKIYNKDKHYRHLVQTMSYLYRRCYNLLDDDYRKGWLCYDTEWWSGDDRDVHFTYNTKGRDEAYERLGFYLGLHADMEKNMIRANLSATQFKMPREGEYDCKEARTMRKILNILHTLFNSDYEIQICETPLGRKKAPTMWALADVYKSESYKKLPKRVLTDEELKAPAGTTEI